MKWKLHKKWTTKSGLEAAIILASPTYPHYCGYVAVPESHPAYGADYANYPSEKDRDMWKPEALHIQDQVNDISVHGGLTYGEETKILKGDDEAYPAESEDNMYWFGFDAAHAGDAVDWDAGAELIENEEERIQVRQVRKIMDKHPIKTDTIKSADYMEEQCESLAEQLVAINELKH